jgi:hypothetical protein
MSKVEDLEKRIEQLEAQLAKLNPPAQAPFVRVPMPRYDFTEAASPPIRLSARELAGPKGSLDDWRKEVTPPTLRPLVPPSGQPPPPVATTVPLGQVPGIAVIDAIALGFDRREKAEEMAKQMDIARKLQGL